MNKEQFVYAARNPKTGKFVSDITNPRKKFWQKKRSRKRSNLCGAKADCENCPNNATCDEIDVIENIINLIDRQKAEIERLQKECEITRAYIHNNGLEWGLVSHLEFCKNQRSEARKEFAERLKLHSYIVSDESKTGIITRYSVVTANQIDNLVKEMEKKSYVF